jgi:hypothetical protein
VNEVLKPGTRLFSSVCSTEVIVVKAPSETLEVLIGGASPGKVSTSGAERPPVASGHTGGTLLGKRYTNAAGSVEFLCTKAGVGSLSVNGELLQPKDAKSLPSSD